MNSEQYCLQDILLSSTVIQQKFWGTGAFFRLARPREFLALIDTVTRFYDLLVSNDIF